MIVQNMPWSCQQMKKIMKRWWEYRNCSNLALRHFSPAKKTMMPRQGATIQPVAPGPVTKLASRKATTLAPNVLAPGSAFARRAKLTMCAPMCMAVKRIIDHAVAL